MLPVPQMEGVSVQFPDSWIILALWGTIVVDNNAQSRRLRGHKYLISYIFRMTYNQGRYLSSFCFRIYHLYLYS